MYAFSVFKSSIVEHLGSSQTAVAWVFSIAIVVLGLSAAFFGTWVERNGPRRAMASRTSPMLISIAWALVVLPLAYGLWFKVEKAVQLFVG
ncbi:MFS transporter small subunit [Kytococcus sp. Marseille-QA3725]